MKAFHDDIVKLTCIVSPAFFLTLIIFSFNNTVYSDYNYVGVQYDGIIVNSTYYDDNCTVQSTLTIESLNQRFVGQYSCSAFIAYTSPEDNGNNITFKVKLAKEVGAGEHMQTHTVYAHVIKSCSGHS